MDGKDLEPMTPWYRGWTGSIEKVSESKFKFTGTIRQLDELKVEVTELPIKMWTQTFKERLEEIIKGEKTPSFIKDYVDYNSPSKVHFVITMSSAEAMQKALAEGLENKFKLSNTVATTNLVAFDPEGRINRYGTIDDIMKEFFFIRMKYYQERKKVLLVDLGEELKKLSNQARFIQMVIRGQLVVGGKKRKEIVAQLKKHSFPLFSKKKDAELAGELEPTLDEPEEDDSSAAAKKDDDVGDGYNYLLGVSHLRESHHYSLANLTCYCVADGHLDFNRGEGTEASQRR
jgi:DNA topoisomerase-2